jgi:pimeloyl-ACP methyl ester carboxylesterase
VVDAPSDHKSGLGSWRLSEEHAQDIGAVIEDVRRSAGAVPLWLIGTSAGTLSAANAAARLAPPKGPDGLVLTSTITQIGGRNAPYGQTSVQSVDLARIKVPSLIVRHREDGCPSTPPGGAEGLLGKLKNAPRTELLTFAGGDPPRSAACEPLSRHGYLGIESQVVGAIAAWMIRGGS